MALIAANGFFVAAEFALVAVDRNALARQVAAGDRRARRVDALVRHLSFHLSGAQLGITATSLVLGFLAGPLLGDLLDPMLGPLGEGIAVAAALAPAAKAACCARRFRTWGLPSRTRARAPPSSQPHLRAMRFAQ